MPSMLHLLPTFRKQLVPVIKGYWSPLYAVLCINVCGEGGGGTLFSWWGYSEELRKTWPKWICYQENKWSQSDEWGKRIKKTSRYLPCLRFVNKDPNALKIPNTIVIINIMLNINYINYNCRTVGGKLLMELLIMNDLILFGVGISKI